MESSKFYTKIFLEELSEITNESALKPTLSRTKPSRINSEYNLSYRTVVEYDVGVNSFLKITY